MLKFYFLVNSMFLSLSFTFPYIFYRFLDDGHFRSDLGDAARREKVGHLVLCPILHRLAGSPANAPKSLECTSRVSVYVVELIGK